MACHQGPFLEWQDVDFTVPVPVSWARRLRRTPATEETAARPTRKRLLAGAHLQARANADSSLDDSQVTF